MAVSADCGGDGFENGEETEMTANQALAALRIAYSNYVKANGLKFAREQFRSPKAPGWIYLPAHDRVVRI